MSTAKLHCDIAVRGGKEQEKANLNVDAKEFRQRRNAAAIADVLMLLMALMLPMMMKVTFNSK